MLRSATVVTPGAKPVIGAIVTAEASSGAIEQYHLAAPGESDSSLNRVPFDSPFGQLLARCDLGSSFVVKAPDGARRMTVVAISYPASVGGPVAGNVAEAVEAR